MTRFPCYWQTKAKILKVAEKSSCPKVLPVHTAYHLGTETAMGKFSHEGELSGLRLPKQMCFYPLNGFNIVFQQPVNSKSAYSKLSHGTVFLRATGPGASLGLTHTQAL